MKIQANTAEDLLNSNNLALWSIFDESQFGIVIVGTDLRFLEMNEEFCRIMGYSKQELKGLTFRDVTHTHFIERDIESIDRLSKGEIPVYKTEKRFIRKDQTIVCMAVTISAIQNESGQFLYFLTIVEDISVRKHSEVALSKSEKRLSLLLKNSLDAILLAKLNGNILEVNTAACIMFGHTEKEFKRIGRNDILDQSDPQMAASIEERLKTGKFRGEVTGIKKDGTKFPVEISASLFYDHNENPLISVIIRDITKSRLSEQALKASEESYRNLFDDNPLMIFTLDTESIVRDVNKAAVQQLGYNMNELVGKPVFHVFHKDTRGDVRSQFNDILQNPEQTYKWVQRMVHKKGYIIWVKGTAKVLHSASGDTRVLIMCVDITKIKKADEELFESENRFWRFAENAKDMIYRMSIPEGRYEFVSPAATELFGCSPEDFYKTPILIQQVMHPDWQEYFRQEWSKLLAGYAPPTYKYQIIHKTGEVKWMNQRNVPIYNDNGQIIAIEGTVTDISASKKVEKELRESENRFRLLFENAPLSYMSLDNDGHLIDVNPAWDYMFGYERDEVIGHHYSEYLTPKSNQLIKKIFPNLIKTGKVRNVEIEMICKNGTHLMVNYDGKIIYAETGKLKYIQCVFSDITKRKRAEDALKESERFLRESQSVAHLGSFVWNISTGIWENSKILDEIFGIDENYKRTYNGWLNIVHPDWREIMNDYVTNVVLEQHQMFDKEFEILRQDDGQIRWVHGLSKLELDKNNLPIKLFGTISDITERKRSEEALKESEERFKALFEHSPDVIFLTDIETGLIIDANHHASELLGKTFKEIIGMHQSKLYPPRYEEFSKVAFQECVEKSKQSGKNHYVELFVLRSDGIEVPVEILSNVITLNGKLAMQWVFRDITERKQAEEKLKNYGFYLEETVKERTAELESAKERAESADRLKSTFLATMSHELRTPLNSIIGFSGILLQEKAGSLNEEQKKQMGMVQTSGRHLLSLIIDILDLSKIEAGQLTTNYASFNIQEVIEDVLKLELPNARNKGLSINFTKIAGMGEIVSDRQRIHQVLLNLLNNAVKFTEKGSVKIDCCEDNDSVKVKVSDTGIGIKVEDLSKLFNPFIQVDNELTRKHQGSGLGLSICKKLLELLDGTINVKSEFGIGSTFSITLPLSEGKVNMNSNQEIT